MSGQTTVATQMTARLQAGAMDDSCRLNDVMTGVSEESTAEIPFGVLLKQGTAPDGVLLLNAQNSDFCGISCVSQAMERDVEIGDTGVKPKMALGRARRGRMTVAVTEAVAVGGAVRYHKTGGYWLTTGSGGNTVHVTSGARYMTATTGAGLAVLEFDCLAFVISAD